MKEDMKDEILRVINNAYDYHADGRWDPKGFENYLLGLLTGLRIAGAITLEERMEIYKKWSPVANSMEE